jgi:hypothetical protein
MANKNSGCILGVGWVLTVIAWILIGIWTFNWVEVNSFWSAILWLIIWHVATSVAYFIVFAIISSIADRFE